MRISFVLPTVNLNGGIRVVAIYARALIAKGHQVTLVSPPPKELPFKSKLKHLLQGNGWPHKLKSYPSHLDDCGLNHRVLNHWRPVNDYDVPDADVVIATWWETAEWVSKLSPRKGAKVYFIQHHEIFHYLPIERCHATYRLPFHKIVIARWLKDVMQEQYGDTVVDIVPNSVDRLQFFAHKRHKQSLPTLGFVYSPIPFKDMKTAYAAIEHIRAALPDLRIICFGANPIHQQLQPPTGTEFHLAPAQDQIRHFYAQCDVWLATSKQEGFYLPAMEAMACRTPVVSTKTGWPAEAIENRRNGMLVEVGDVDGLATAAQWILSLPDEQWQELSERAYETASAGSWELSSQLFENALLRAIDRAKRGEIAGGVTDTI